MASGGYRPGAGRPKGSRTVKRVAHECDNAEIAESQSTPLDYMLTVMNDVTADAARRDRMAIAAAPFIHARAESAKLGKKDQKLEQAEKVAGKFSGLRRVK